MIWWGCLKVSFVQNQNFPKKSVCTTSWLKSSRCQTINKALLTFWHFLTVSGHFQNNKGENCLHLCWQSTINRELTEKYEKICESGLKMTLQSGLTLCPDLATDAKWSSVDLSNLFENGGLSNLWNDLVRSGELVSNDPDSCKLWCFYIWKFHDFESIN